MIPGQPSQPPNPAVYRQPVVYLAVQTGQNSIPPSPAGQQVVRNPMPTDPNQRTIGQICTCPPEVHKALMEGKLIPTLKSLRMSNPHSDAQAVRPTSLLVSPVSSQIHTGTHTVSNSNPPVIPPSAVTSLSQHQGGQPVQLILIPTSSSVGMPQYIITPTMTQPASNNNVIVKDTHPVPPDVLVTSGQSNLSPNLDTAGQVAQELRIPVSCMESQLAHLSAWVQLLQKSPGTTISSRQLAGYPHRYCGTNACRLIDDKIGTPCTDTELSYTPSNSSLDSAYSARSNTSSDSGSNRLEVTMTHTMPTETSCNDDVLHPPQPPTVNTEVQTVGPVEPASFDPTAAQPDYCHVFTVPNCSAPTNQTLIAQHRAEMQLLKHKLKLLRTDLSKVKFELATLRRTEQSIMTQHREAIATITKRVEQCMIRQTPNLNHNPVQLARYNINHVLNAYAMEAREADQWIKDLDMAIEDLRAMALSRRSQIPLSDIETLTLHLTRIGHRLKNFKGELPKIFSSLQRVMDAELRNINRNQKFIDTESTRIDEALERCKQMTSTLFTLERLGAVQEHSAGENVPYIRTIREPTFEERKNLMSRITSLVPDHDARVRCIQEFEELSKCKKRLADAGGSEKFERILCFPEDPLHSIELIHHSNNMLESEADPRILSKEAEFSPDVRNSPQPKPDRRSASNEVSQKNNCPNNLVNVQPSSADNRQYKLREVTQTESENQFSSNSQEDLRHAEPNSLLDDHLSLVPDSPDMSLNHIEKNSTSTTGNHQQSIHKAPTILKWNSPTEKVRSFTSSSKGNGVKNRRSRVVFSRTVLVSNGLETTQLNCPSETDEEGEDIIVSHRTCPGLTLDDMVINRTSEPWHPAPGLESRSCKQSSSQSSRFIRALKTFARSDQHYPHSFADKSAVSNTPDPKSFTPMVQRRQQHQHHHHNCQNFRQNAKLFSEADEVMFGSLK